MNDDIVEVYGIKDGKEHHLGSMKMPPKMKARELVTQMFGHFTDEDGSDADFCMCAMEQLIEYMEEPKSIKLFDPVISKNVMETGKKVLSEMTNLLNDQEDAERWRYAISDSGNQTMNFLDIYDDWDGDGYFVDYFDEIRKSENDR